MTLNQYKLYINLVLTDFVSEKKWYENSQAITVLSTTIIGLPNLLLAGSKAVVK